MYIYIYNIPQHTNKDILKWYILQKFELQLEANLKELYNQGINVQVTIQDVTKKTTPLHEIPNP